MANLALLDLVLPYVFRGESLGPTHAALSALRVVTFESATDDLGVTLRGHCEVNGYLEFLPSSGTLVSGGVDEAEPAHDPARSDPVFDLRDTTVDFELFVPRAGSQIVSTAQATFPAVAAPTSALFDDWAAAVPSDYPSTGFTFDLILNAPKLRPPFLHPAKVGPIGVLEPDPSVREVAITLPRLRFRVAHGNPLNSQLVFSFVAAGVSDLDDPGSTEVSQLISMEPPYAYIGGAQDRAVGLGFRSATLDLDGDWTPPALREKAGVGDDWTGLYLPEVRLFVAPDGLRNLAFECGAQELLIGLDRTGGIWGDFEAALVQQGSGEITLNPRFDSGGRSYVVTRGITVGGVVQAVARVPEHSTLVVDVTGGRTPYARQVTINGTAQPAASMYDVDLGPTGTASIDLTVTSGATSGTPGSARMHIEVLRLTETVRIVTPGTSTPHQQPATITAETGFDFDLADGRVDPVTIATAPPVEGLVWKEGGTTLATGAALTTALAGPATRSFTVERPGATGPTALDYYFFFDCPGTGGSEEMATQPATSRLSQTWSPGAEDPVAAYEHHFSGLANGTAITISGDASYEGDPDRREYNTKLAWRRAMRVRTLLASRFASKNFSYTVEPVLANPAAPTAAEQAAWAAAVGWTSHVAPADRDHWRATVSFTASTGAATGSVTVARPAPTTTTTPAVTEVVDPPVPENSPPPDWFRSARVKVRIVESELIALQLDLEVDINTMTEERLQGQMGTAPPGTPLPRGKTLERGTPVGPDNPADGIVAFRVLVQTDPATGRVDTLLMAGADPADTDGLFHFGWIPQVDPMPASKDLGVTFLGSYLSFWPLLALAPPVDAVRNAAEGRDGAVVDAVLSGAALTVPAVVAALPWFAVERVILYGAEYFHTQRDGGFTGTLLADVEADWSVDLLGIVKIPRTRPLKVRYKAIGLRLTNRDADPPLPPGATDLTRWDFLPVFDSSRGYTIDVASGGGLEIAPPLGQILRIAGARLSRSNPMTLEVDINLAVDLGVVAIDQASVRAYLDGSAPPELTALSARIDIPGAVVGSGYMRIGTKPDGTKTIGGQIDITIRPVSVRIAAALEIAQINKNGRSATGVYVGLNVVLPAGIPLGSTGLGIFGFRGIFGMHYKRAEITGPQASAPALEWLKKAEGQPHLLKAPTSDTVLWEPELDRWSFGVGILIGTMEGGFLINLDGTFMLELPGPRVLIMMNARILSLPPSMDGMGQKGGVLAVIEITPEHFLIGLVLQWEIESLVKIVVPVEAVFPFGSQAHKWHIYLGARRDYGASVEVDVLGIVRGSGYLMFRGDGLQAFDNGHDTLPAIQGFGIALGVAASFTWGSVDAGLYLTVGGGMDAVLGFSPLLIVGNIWVAGELRLWIISVGADANLTVKVAEIEGPPGPDGEPTTELSLYVHGEACGHVDFFFFEVSGCVEITISGPEHPAPVPTLVEKVSLQSRSPALAQGTAVDKPVDAALGQAAEGTSYPGDGAVPFVPIDAIPVISMLVPAGPDGAVTVPGLGTLGPAPGLDPQGYAARSSERYRYRIKRLVLERVKGNGQVDPVTFAAGSTAIPPVWWSVAAADEANPAAQLALLTWQATPATKAIELNDKLVEDVKRRWGTVCSPAAAPAEVLWTFKLEALGPSLTGWELDGVAWPDLPGTRRGAPPDTTLDVSEPWRSGDASLDALRGVVPAIVIGGVVDCHRRRVRPELRDFSVAIADSVVRTHLERPVESPTRVVVGGAGPVDDDAPVGELLPDDDPVRSMVAPVRDSVSVRISEAFHRKATEALPGLRDLAAAGSQVADVSGLLGAETAVETGGRVGSDLAVQGLLDLGALLAGRTTTDVRPGAASNAGTRCPVKVLQGPVRDDGFLTNLPDPSLDAVLSGAKVPQHPDSELVDLVHLHTGPYAAADVLLFLPRFGRKSFTPVEVRALDAGGQVLDRHEVTTSDLLGSGAVLPSRWTDLSGPWGHDVDDLLRWAQERKLAVAIVHLEESKEAVLVEIGRPRDRQGQKGQPPTYYVAAFGMVSGAEVARADWDTTQIAEDRTRLINATGPGSTTNALLVPDSRYRIVVEWYADRKKDGATRGSAATPQKQTFWFHTDKIVAGPVDPARPNSLVFDDTPEHVPVRLDPWVMCSLPADEELNWFGHEPLRLVFNTHDVDRIFGAHGKELRLRLEAANGQHPTDTGSGAALPLTVDAATLTPLDAHLKSPWAHALDQAVTELEADGSTFCVPVSGTLATHSELLLDVPLEPFMGYLLDVELVAQGAPASARGPRMLRRHLTTGAFGTLEALASSVAGCLPTAASAPAGTFTGMLGSLGTRPQGARVDQHLLAAGLEPLGAPDHPRVVVFWEQTGTAAPQPAAVMIDASAPLSRRRPYPAEVTDTTVPGAPKRWVLADREWLTLVTGGDAGIVSGVVWAPGEQRAFVVLQPGSRGKRLTVDLVALGMPDLPFLGITERRAQAVAVSLLRAPWEEV